MSRTGRLVFTAAIAVAAVTGIVTSAFADPAEVDTPAESVRRMQVTPTIPQPSTREIVNALPYQHYDDVPAMTAYRLVAAERGWTSATIEAWAPFVHDVMLGESAFCWNRRRGDIVKSYSVGCIITRQGTHEDVGFGQVTAVLYGAQGPLCVDHGYCGRQSILASPYDSMLASIVLVIEDLGSQPWCWSARARSYHPTCRSAPG